MIRSPILDAATEAFSDALEDGKRHDAEDPRWERVQKMLKDAATEFEETLLWRLREDMPGHLAAVARDAAAKAIEAVLNGDEQELRRWLSCDSGAYTGRAGEGYYARSQIEAHPIIHGKLFEQGAVLLRKRIVDAHAELLKTERILDLEDQLASVTLQYNKMKDERDRERASAF